MGGEAAVGSADGPAVAVERNAARAGGDDGLDGDDKAFGKEMTGGGIGKIGDAGLFVNGAAYAVAAEFADDMETAAADFALDGATDVLGAIAGTRGGESLAEGALGTTGESAGFFLRGRDLDADGGIGVVAVFDGGEVKLDEIAGLEDAIAGNAVDDFVVHADADVAGEMVDERWRGLRAVFGEDARADGGEFGSGDAGTDRSGHGAESFGDDLAAGAEFFELVGTMDGHELLPSVILR